MDITTANLSALVTAADMRLQNIWDSVPAFMDKVGTTIPCPSSTMLMPWLQIFPQLREWFGDRKYNNYIANSLQFTPKLWELTQSISRSEIEDDLHGLWLSMAPQRIVREVKLQPDKLVSELLEQNPTGWDGVPFFDGYHPVDFSNPNSPDTNNNVLLNAPLTQDNVAALRAQMIELEGPDGISLNFVPDTLMVPPALELAGRIVANATFLPTTLGSALGNAQGPVSNVFSGFYNLIVNPYLTDQNRWYLLSTSHGISPLLWIERIAPQIVYQMNPEDFMVFNTDNFAIGVRRRGIAGLSMYYLAGVGTSESVLSPITPASQKNT